MRVPADAVAGEVGVRQEAPLAVEGRAVAVETLGEGEHDVGELVHLVADLAVRDLPEGERDGALPHLEGLADGLVRPSLAHLGGVVLYAVGVRLGGRWGVIVRPRPGPVLWKLEDFVWTSCTTLIF